MAIVRNIRTVHMKFLSATWEKLYISQEMDIPPRKPYLIVNGISSLALLSPCLIVSFSVHRHSCQFTTRFLETRGVLSLKRCTAEVRSLGIHHHYSGFIATVNLSNFPHSINRRFASANGRIYLPALDHTYNAHNRDFHEFSVTMPFHGRSRISPVFS